MMCDVPSIVAITGAVMAIDSDFEFCSTTGEVIAMLSFFVLPPKIYPATIRKPLLSAS